VNGRRFVSGYTSSTTNVVDVNMIPTDFIERVDIITGGASAVYGSEAISGVVNFILKDHFDGIRVRGQGGGATEGGANTRLGSLTVGNTFAENRGSAMLNISYDRDSGVRSPQRSISGIDTSITRKGIFGAFSSFNPQGNYTLADANGNVDDGLYTFDKSGAIVPYATSLGFKRDAYRRITIPPDRTLISGIVRYDLAEKQQFYTEFTYGITHTLTQIEPFALEIGPALTTDNVYGGSGVGIPVTNVYIPAGLKAIIAADNADPTITGFPATATTPAHSCSTGTAADCITYIGERRRLTDVAIRSSEARRTPGSGRTSSRMVMRAPFVKYANESGQVAPITPMRMSSPFRADPSWQVPGQVYCRRPLAVASAARPRRRLPGRSQPPQAADHHGQRDPVGDGRGDGRGGHPRTRQQHDEQHHGEHGGQALRDGHQSRPVASAQQVAGDLAGRHEDTARGEYPQQRDGTGVGRAEDQRDNPV